MTTKSCSDGALLDRYKEEFGDWKEEDFEQVNKDILRALRDALIFKGVNINKGSGKKIARCLAVALNWDIVPDWTTESLKTEKFAVGTRAYKYPVMIAAMVARGKIQYSSPVGKTRDVLPPPSSRY